MKPREQVQQSRLPAYYDFFGRPLGWLARLLLLVSLVILPFAWRGPLWTMSFESNQYPDPLRLAIHIDHLAGQKTETRDDLREINSLNHYIGMRPLLESDFSEFLWLPFVVGIFGLLTLRLVAFGRLRDLVDVTVLYGYFGLFSLWQFYSKLRTYGHELDPAAAIKVAPFIPPMYGRVKIANFWVESYPGLAAFALTAFAMALGVVLLIALGQAWRSFHSRPGADGASPLTGLLCTHGFIFQAVCIGSVVASCWLPDPVQAATLECGTGKPLADPAAALAVASSGDDILVAAGSYHGDLIVDKSVQLRGLGQVEIVGQGMGNVITVRAAGSQLENLAISGSGHDMMRSHAAVRIEADDVQLQGCTLRGNLFGVYVSNCKRALIHACSITGPPHAGLGSRGAGIHLYVVDNCVISGNHVQEVRDGVYFDHSNHNLVEDNVFSHLRYGVHYMYCEANEFYRNTFRDSMAGVAIMYTDGVKFSDNQILNNRWGHNAFGLLLQACNDCVAERNVIVNNTCGFFLEGARNNQFRNNLVAYNDVGAVVFGSSSGNLFESNDFVQNLATLRCIGKPDVRWSSPGGQGNYYSDYEGYDLDTDSRGDLPHKLQNNFEYLTGNHPLLQLYLSSAAADALVLAERSFPILPQSDYSDPHPSMRPVSRTKLQLAASDVLKAHGSVPAMLVSTVLWCLMLVLTRRLAR